MDNDLALLAARALEFVADGARVGLGTGRAATAFAHALGARVRAGLQVRGVPTSEATAQLARELGIPLGTLDSPEPLQVTVDGADEVERQTLNLVKGWGGSLVRERIVAAASRRQVILVTEEKIVDRLGARGRLPVEVLPFAAGFCARRIEQLGLRPAVRQAAAGGPFVSDNGNWILDCGLAPPADPAGLDRALRAVPGVIDTGLFLGTASAVLVALGGTLQEWRPSHG
jgi:ribose 5-phosphate isomerase A